MKSKIKGEIEKSYVASKNHQFNIEEWTNEEWESIKETSKYGKMKDTGVCINVLKDLGEKISTLPED
jgi:2-oxoglutarate dehydrogenase E1 component